MKYANGGKSEPDRCQISEEAAVTVHLSARAGNKAFICYLAI